jgi:lactoylglutathione lyase
MITRLLHTRYRVNDLEKTVSFYRDVLGLKEISRHTSGRGSTLVFFEVSPGAEQIEICHYPASGPVQVQSDLTHLAFEVDDLNAFAKAAEAKGYPLSDGPHATGSGSRIAFIDGPEGYEFELIEKKKKG